MGSVFKGLPNEGTQPCWKELLLSNPFQSHQFSVFTGFEGWRGTEDIFLHICLLGCPSLLAQCSIFCTLPSALLPPWIAFP